MSPNFEQGGTDTPLDFHRAFCDLILEADEVEIDDIVRSFGQNPQHLEIEAKGVIQSALVREIPGLKESEPLETLNVLHRGFNHFMRVLRRSSGLEILELAVKARVDQSELQQIESQPGFLPTPRTIFQLERYFGLPTDTLSRSCGAITGTDSQAASGLLRFAACSGGMGKLTREEKELLVEFVRQLAA